MMIIIIIIITLPKVITIMRNHAGRSLESRRRENMVGVNMVLA